MRFTVIDNTEEFDTQSERLDASNFNNNGLTIEEVYVEISDEYTWEHEIKFSNGDMIVWKGTPVKHYPDCDETVNIYLKESNLWVEVYNNEEENFLDLFGFGDGDLQTMINCYLTKRVKSLSNCSSEIDYSKVGDFVDEWLGSEKNHAQELAMLMDFIEKYNKGNFNKK